MGSIKGVIFDLDGTLIDSLGALTHVFNEVILTFDVGPISKERLATYLNRAYGLEEMLLELAPHAFNNKDVIRKSMDDMRKAYYRIEKESVCLIPGAQEVLSSLKMKGLKLGIVTARKSFGEVKWRELRRLNISQFIDAMVTGAEAPRKPAPDGIIKCLKELRLSPQESIFVGDTQMDIIAGNRANVRVVAISTGIVEMEKLAAEKPTALIKNLTQLVATIQELEKGTSSAEGLDKYG